VKLYIYGAGGHGKVVLDAMQSTNQPCYGFIDNKNIAQWAGITVYNNKNLPNVSAGIIHIAIGDAATRTKLVQQLNELGYSFFTVQHPLAVIAPYATVGNHVIVNHGAVIDHDCSVGDVCHIAPRAVLGGGVTVGDRVFIGSGAIVLPKISIGDDAIIGAGAVVTKSVAAGTTVVGNPARLLIK
jgi:acetyltransferase-like isoleucine patch superfamily enzyme